MRCQHKLLIICLLICVWSLLACSQDNIESKSKYPRVRQAYKESCKLTGLTFSGNYMDVPSSQHDYEKRFICCIYEENKLTPFQREILKTFNCPFEQFLEEAEHCTADQDDYWNVYPQGLAKMIMWFISLSIPDLEFEMVQEKI